MLTVPEIRNQQELVKKGKIFKENGAAKLQIYELKEMEIKFQ